MNKFSTTKWIGILGMLIWALAGFLRDTWVASIPVVNFILGIAPNFGALWGFASLVEYNYPILFKKEFTFRLAVISVMGIFLLALLSEIIHDVFLGSPFDIYDMIATFITADIYVLLSFFTYSKKKK
nr:hypothetical protein [uncultured Niameybacter sp.]